MFLKITLYWESLWLLSTCTSGSSETCCNWSISCTFTACLSWNSISTIHFSAQGFLQNPFWSWFPLFLWDMLQCQRKECLACPCTIPTSSLSLSDAAFQAFLGLAVITAPQKERVFNNTSNNFWKGASASYWTREKAIIGNEQVGGLYTSVYSALENEGCCRSNCHKLGPCISYGETGASSTGPGLRCAQGPGLSAGAVWPQRPCLAWGANKNKKKCESTPVNERAAQLQNGLRRICNRADDDLGIFLPEGAVLPGCNHFPCLGKCVCLSQIYLSFFFHLSH